MIIRTPKNRENPYAQINKFALADPGLTWKAKGILAYLLTLPDDWTLRPREIQKHAIDGRDSIYSGLNELITAGYLIREQKRGKYGEFKEIVYVLHEFPLVSSVISKCTGLPDPGFPYTDDYNVHEEKKFERGERGNISDPAAIERKKGEFLQ